MNTSRPSVVWSETRSVIRLSGPFTAAYATGMAMYITDLAIVGQLGVAQLAGVAQAEQIVFLLISVLGTIMSFASVAIANAIGARDSSRAVSILQQSVLIAAFISIPATLISLNIASILTLFGVDPTITGYAGEYGKSIAWCVLPYLLFILLRSFLAAVDRPKAVLFTTASAILANACLSYSLTLGAFGFEGFGVSGAGMATSLVTVLMVISLAFSIYRDPPLPGLKVTKVRPKIDLGIWSHVFRKGTPAAIATVLEDSLFVAAAIVVGTFGVAALAAHYLASTVVNVGVLLANGIGDATSIRVAVLRGRGNTDSMRIAGFSGAGLCGCLLSAFAVIMLIDPVRLSSFFIGSDQAHSQDVLALTVQVFLIAAISQIVEGVQVVTTRALRGMEDTFVPLVIAVCGYWFIAFPMGVGFAHLANLGLNGMWLGVTCGLTATAAALLWRYNELSRSSISAMEPISDPSMEE